MTTTKYRGVGIMRGPVFWDVARRGASRADYIATCPCGWTCTRHYRTTLQSWITEHRKECDAR